MNSNQFRTYGQETVDYIGNYLDTIEKRRVVSSVEPGYLAPLLPKEAPLKPESWDAIMKDMEEKIMPGITHWQHPHFHAYFPSAASYPGILGDMISGAIGCIGFSWAASPACTELETVCLDWLARALNLPKHYIFSEPGSTGGGVLESSASESILVALLAARTQAIKYIKEKCGGKDDHDSVYLPKLVAYCSKEAHSCVEKASMIALTKLRILETDENESLRGSTLQKAIEEDIAQGLHPFFVVSVLGTTGTTAFDCLDEIGPIVRSLPACWLHCDGAYGANSFICPELRGPMKGLELADSINVNCNKWLLVNFDCNCLFVKDRLKLTSALVVDPLYLQHDNSKVTIDYRHWGISLSRRFRALKLWFTFRSYGIEGLQKYVRNQVAMAKHFEKLVLTDCRFEVVNDVKLGLVCFRLKGSDIMNQDLLAIINSTGRIHMVPAKSKGKYVIRYAICNEHAKPEDNDYAWKEILHQATKTLEASKYNKKPLPTPDAKSDRKLSRRFSFTRSVSRDVYEHKQSRGSLHDGATPLPVYENDDMEDVFEQLQIANQCPIKQNGIK